MKGTEKVISDRDWKMDTWGISVILEVDILVENVYCNNVKEWRPIEWNFKLTDAFINDIEEVLSFAVFLRRNYIVGCMKLSNGGSVNLPSQKIHAQEQFLTFHTIMFCFSSKLWNPVHARFPWFLLFHWKSLNNLQIFPKSEKISFMEFTVLANGEKRIHVKARFT